MAAAHPDKQGNDRGEGGTGQKNQSLSGMMTQIGLQDDGSGEDRYQEEISQNRRAEARAPKGGHQGLEGSLKPKG